MDVTIREATPADAPFLAWVMQTAARSHRPICFWDLAFPGPDQPRLEYLAALALAEPPSFVHYGGFLLAEAAGKPVAGLSAYDSAEKNVGHFGAAVSTLLAARGWSPEHLELLASRVAPAAACMPDSPAGVWVVEWVAALPEARGRGIAAALLKEVLARGRSAGYKRAQIAFLIGNTPARTVYERAGFTTVEEIRQPEFEAIFGTPGVARMVCDL